MQASHISRQGGFTLIELVLVIAVLGIITASFLPKFTSVSVEATLAAENRVVGAVRSAIHLHYAEQCSLGNCGFPDVLDTALTALCSQSNPCFEDILAQPITDQWEKTTATRYKGPSENVYEYDNVTGSFNEI